ncbi:hypothetical protein DOE76_09460 [Leifsonia sp. ku-ls]|nr:hypothetical protein DOE76_09460 [Leifsonia sp. ku-ls]
MNIREFVVGVDGSVPARAAVRWAIAHARERAAAVSLVHVADDEWGAVGSRLIDEVDAGAGALLDEELANARASAPAGVSVTGELRTGSPMVVLASYSRPERMLVVGTHKTGFHYGRAFGSRSLQLANLATGPVAIIPEAESRLRRGVVVGVDDTAAGNAALDLAADLACDHHCELVAVRSSSLQQRFEADRDDELRDWQLRRDDDARELLAAAVTRARRRQPGITIRSRVVRRTPGTALNEVARAAELLVIGDSRREAPERGGLGSVAYDVLLNVSSPTIVVHAPEPLRAETPAAHQPEGEAHAVG